MSRLLKLSASVLPWGVPGAVVSAAMLFFNGAAAASAVLYS